MIGETQPPRTFRHLRQALLNFHKVAGQQGWPENRPPGGISGIAKFLQKRLFEDHEIHVSVSCPKKTCSHEPRIWNLYLAKVAFRNKKPSWPGLGKYNYTVPAQALPFIRDFKEPMSEPLPLLPKAYWSGSACARWGNSNVERLFRMLRTASRLALPMHATWNAIILFQAVWGRQYNGKHQTVMSKRFCIPMWNFTNVNHQVPFFCSLSIWSWRNFKLKSTRFPDHWSCRELSVA